MSKRPYRGVFPVAPTIFNEDGTLDLEGQRRCLDFLIDAGSNGICILANFSEQFLLSDEERETLLRLSLDHVAGRVPVVVTTSHFSTDICAARWRAQDAGAAMVMVLPPYHGATLRVGEAGILEFYRAVSDAVSVPIMVQDAPIAGTTLTAPFLAQMAREIENLLYFKIETPQAAAKLREMIRLGGASIEGPWDGEEGITLLPDLDAGATGCMSGGGYPDGLRAIIDAHAAGKRQEAAALYEKWLPLINYENRQCGLETPKILMKEGGVIKSDRLRRPLRGVTPQTRQGLLNVARPLDPLVLRWGR
jgi:4-hydroxy-tetrahydrodipicolinate synthase